MAVTRGGHVKIARKTFAEDKWWKAKRAYSKWEAWVDMIQLAQWEAREFCSTKFGTIRLERGEFILSERKMAERWSWGRQSVRSFTSSHTFCTRVATQRTTPAGTVYLIVNYDLYQSAELSINPPSNPPKNPGLTQDQPRTNPRTSSKAVKQLSTSSASRRERYAFMGVLKPIWKGALGGYMPKGAATLLEEIVLEHGIEKVAQHLQNYVAQTTGQFASLNHFKLTFGTWGGPSGAAKLWAEIKRTGILQDTTTADWQRHIAEIVDTKAIENRERFEEVWRACDLSLLRSTKNDKQAIEHVGQALAKVAA